MTRARLRAIKAARAIKVGRAIRVRRRVIKVGQVIKARHRATDRTIRGRRRDMATSRDHLQDTRAARLRVTSRDRPTPAQVLDMVRTRDLRPAINRARLRTENSMKSVTSRNI